MDANKPEAEVSSVLNPGGGHKAPLGLKTVAIFEFVKGFLVLLLALGLVSLVHRDAAREIKDMVRNLHLNPDHHYLVMFLAEADRLDDRKLWILAALALAYATIRFVETYGLWHERPWAEWFAVISAGFYLPLEIHHVFEGPGRIFRWLVLLVNIVIVAYLGYLLAHNPRKLKRRWWVK